jgi:hypothetical protein
LFHSSPGRLQQPEIVTCQIRSHLVRFRETGYIPSGSSDVIQGLDWPILFGAAARSSLASAHELAKKYGFRFAYGRLLLDIKQSHFGTKESAFVYLYWNHEIERLLHTYLSEYCVAMYLVGKEVER